MLILYDPTLDGITLYYYNGDVLMFWYCDYVNCKLYETEGISTYRNMHTLLQYLGNLEIVHDDGEA